MYLTIEKCRMMNISKKLGVVTTSSIKTKVVAKGERFPKCIWFRYFRLIQGDRTKEDVLTQDNQLSILLYKNFLFSTGKGSKHINIRYFFVIDKLKHKEVRIVYCLIEEILADFSSKLL